MGPGDVFEISVVGEKDLPKDYKVNADGTLDFHYLQRVAVIGLEPQQVGDLLKQKLVEAKIDTRESIPFPFFRHLVVNTAAFVKAALDHQTAGKALKAVA